MKKTVSALLTVLLLLSLAVPAFAAGNVGYMAGVTEAMCSPDYWLNKQKNADRVLMTPAQITAYNKLTAATENTMRVDLFSVERTYDASALLESLVRSTESEKSTRDLFIDGKQIDKDAFYAGILSAMRGTGLGGTQQLRYAICTTHTGIYALPTDTFVGYSATDTDSEFQLSELRVNEPFLIKQVCTYQGKTFCWGLSDHLSGWVNAAHLAVCSDRKTWKDAFSVQPDAKDFIVVTDDSITTEPSLSVPATSSVRLAIGTVLKLVPEQEIPRNVGERNRWHNYVVYLPARNENGTYRREVALISQNCDVSVGYLPLTQANLLKTAFNCLGDRYGWAGTLGAMDCSLYTRAVYLCCGVNMPRNTTWQQNVPNTKFNLSAMTDAQKLKFLSKLPAGALLYFPGHTMIYIGTENNMAYVISDTGSVSAPTGALQVESTYSVIINPLSARRRNGSTWLSNLTAAVLPSEAVGHYEETTVTKATTQKDGKRVTVCAVCGKTTEKAVIPAAKTVVPKHSKVAYTGKALEPGVTVKDRSGKKIDPANYTVKYKNNTNVGTATAIVKLRGSYSGTLKTTFKIVPKETKIKSVQTSGDKLIVTWKRQTAQTSGYQIEYARNAAFTKGNVTVTVKDPKVTVDSLDAKKAGTYYIRIRTYAKQNADVLHSAWSELFKIVKQK